MNIMIPSANQTLHQFIALLLKEHSILPDSVVNLLQTWHTDRGHLLLRTPVPVLFALLVDFFFFSDLFFSNVLFNFNAKEKYRGMFENQKSGNKKSSGEIGLNIITLANPKVGQDQVSGGVRVLGYRWKCFSSSNDFNYTDWFGCYRSYLSTLVCS